MTETELADLRAWAEAHAPVGYLQAHQVLSLLDRDELRQQEVADCDAWICQFREQLARYNPVPFAHPCL